MSRGLCIWSRVPSRGLMSRGLCLGTLSGGSLSRGVSRGSLSGRVSVWGSLTWGVSVQGVSVRGVSFQRISVWEGLCLGFLSEALLGGLCQSGKPPNGDPHYSLERAVRILLECILVTHFIHSMSSTVSGSQNSLRFSRFFNSAGSD